MKSTLVSLIVIGFIALTNAATIKTQLKSNPPHGHEVDLESLNDLVTSTLSNGSEADGWINFIGAALQDPNADISKMPMGQHDDIFTVEDISGGHKIGDGHDHAEVEEHH